MAVATLFPVGICNSTPPSAMQEPKGILFLEDAPKVSPFFSDPVKEPVNCARSGLQRLSHHAGLHRFLFKARNRNTKKLSCCNTEYGASIKGFRRLRWSSPTYILGVEALRTNGSYARSFPTMLSLCVPRGRSKDPGSDARVASILHARCQARDLSRPQAPLRHDGCF